MRPDAPLALSVVVPAHNAGALVEATARRLAVRLADRRAEILLVENASTDDTLERCKRLARNWPDGPTSVSVLQSPKGMGSGTPEGHRGKPRRSGAPDGRRPSLWFDDLDAADRLGAESGGLPPVIIGSKAHPDSQAGRTARRNLLTTGFAMFRRLILNTHVGDSQGTILIQGDLARALVPRLCETGYLFSTELIHVVERGGIRPLEVPVRLSADHQAHPSRVSPWDVVRMGLGLVRLRVRHRSQSRLGASLRIDHLPPR